MGGVRRQEARAGAEGSTDDPFAADLRALGFPRRALMVTSATMRASFGAPEPI